MMLLRSSGQSNFVRQLGVIDNVISILRFICDTTLLLSLSDSHETAPLVSSGSRLRRPRSGVVLVRYLHRRVRAYPGTRPTRGPRRADSREHDKSAPAGPLGRMSTRSQNGWRSLSSCVVARSRDSMKKEYHLQYPYRRRS
ncbi:uncharacterized protein LOC124363437 [Homalodisca vitripennis]|uniref:uncharacterized protein LOC124363437 n=1 Tax=Homalodisca vitripennis TaxID=197043 RepID=UPI001EEC4AAF|nr:uncharacterized protein LOC124363437 [Homalodisca vitripennis]